jgi:hypothetical protein
MLCALERQIGLRLGKDGDALVELLPAGQLARLQVGRLGRLYALGQDRRFLGTHAGIDVVAFRPRRTQGGKQCVREVSTAIN